MPSRTYVVTGAASGIGLALTLNLRAAGNRVITADLAHADVNADLATSSGRAELVRKVADKVDDMLDGVAACAGIGTQEPAALSVNYFGAVATLHGLCGLLARSAAPRAVAIASIACIDRVDEDLVAACLSGDETAALSMARPESFTVYSSSKAALVRWARAAAISRAWAGAGILLNVIAPGLIRTPMTQRLMQDVAVMEELRAAIPAAVGRWGDAQDVARLAAFLLSADNSYMVGQVIFADGGAEAVRRGAAAPLLAPSAVAFGATQREPA